MKGLNPIALVFWLACACAGFLIGGGITGAVAGLLVGLSASLLTVFMK